MPTSRPTRSKLQRWKKLSDNSKSKFTLQSLVRAFPSAPELTYFQPGLPNMGRPGTYSDRQSDTRGLSRSSVQNVPEGFQTMSEVGSRPDSSRDRRTLPALLPHEQ